MEFLAAFILALLISLAFAVRNRKGSSLTHLVIFFFILFMAGIAGQYWIIPFGPVLWGVSWLPLLSILLIVTLLFAAPPPHKEEKKTGSAEDQAPVVVAVSIFVWILLAVLLIAILIGFARRSDKSPELYKKETITILTDLKTEGIK